MFEPIPVDIRTSKAHGGFVLLDSFRFEHGDLEVRVFAPGSGDTARLHFSDVIGFSMREDVFAPDPDGGPERRARPTGAPTGGFFMKSTASPTMTALRGAAPRAVQPGIADHEHYRLQLREHELSFVASRTYEMNVMSADMANQGE